MENLNKRPSKGILKFSRDNSVEKDQIKWDEDNIKDTLHPEDKDYGLMKIEEPPTPYCYSPRGESSDDEDAQNKTKDLLERVSRRIKEPPVTIENVEGLFDESDLDAIEKYDDDASDSPSTSQLSGSKNSDFELKRKRHYNEFHAVKLAKKLMQKELDEDSHDDKV